MDVSHVPTAVIAAIRRTEFMEYRLDSGLASVRLDVEGLQVGVGCAKAVNVSSRLRCLRTKTGNACSALRAFARQGHLVGTVDRPMLVAPS
jgi:hypothetical protein